jgi:hypothetical protein
LDRLSLPTHSSTSEIMASCRSRHSGGGELTVKSELQTVNSSSPTVTGAWGCQWKMGQILSAFVTTKDSLRQVCKIVGVGPQSQKSGTFTSRRRPAICACASEKEPAAANARSAVRCSRWTKAVVGVLMVCRRPSNRRCDRNCATSCCTIVNCRHTEATIFSQKRDYSSSCRSRRRVSISPRSLVTTFSRSSTVGTSSRMGAGSSRVTR